MDLRGSIMKQTHVAMNLATHLMLTESKDSNLVFSPLSLQVLISLIAAGAKGSTLDQILSFLKSESTEELNAFSAELVGGVFKDGSANGGPRLSVANGVWVDKSLSLKHSFKQAVESQYKASVDDVDFQTKVGYIIYPYEVINWLFDFHIPNSVECLLFLELI